jgi:bifunctional non-homologous end joining protein LigD
MAANEALADYRRMRDFAQTPEPRGEPRRASSQLSFVIQKHAARSLHYDFRLELDGTLKSWAVPKGPSLDPAVKRMAVQVEDHPLSYADFEGTIPPKHYGAGTVIVWDRGTWSPIGDAHTGLRDGHLKFDLVGEKLRGRWALVRMKPRERERQPTWLLMKERDDAARAADTFDVLAAAPDSVLTKPPPPSSKAALPEALSPQLATLVDSTPPGDDWRYEIKFDGYRLLTRIDNRSVRCFTRNGNDWSAKLPALVDAVRALKLAPCWLDGEIVVQGEDGTPDFQALQNVFDAKRTSALTYFVFDLPFHEGQDLRSRPLAERRERLQRLIAPSQGPVRFSEAFDGKPDALLASASAAGLEGLIGKRADSPYRSGRSTDWIKLKSRQRQEFVIGGYTDPNGARNGIGSLLLGVHDAKGGLRFAGNVGTGFDERTLAALKKRLAKIERPSSPFIDSPNKVGARSDRTSHWVEPSLVAEVSFAQWTTSGRIRHSSFHGLRDDKPAAQVVQEEPMHATAQKRTKTAQPTVTHADRVIDAESGITKGELADFCARVAEVMLPHLKARPVALVRAPDGVAGGQFFQKHATEAHTLAGFARLDPSLDPGHDALLVVSSAEGLASAAQMNVIELHTWNMTTRTTPRPDRMVFDLDPGSGVEWPAVREAAQLLRAFLGEIGLATCLLKTSGGKGLHAVVPIAPKYEWQLVRQFAQAVVVHMAEVVPQRFVSKSGPSNRVGKIFIDYLRNGWGATTASAWSARSRPGLGVSVPIDWSELAQVSGGAHWSLRNIDARLAIGNTPWGAFASSRQTLAKAMKALDFQPNFETTKATA